MSTVNFNDTTPATGSQKSINVKWLSDASGNISASYSPAAWATFTPTVSAGAATVAVTTANVDYLPIGSVNYVNLNLNITLSGAAAGSTITVTLPITPVAGSTFHAPATINAGSGWTLGLGAIAAGAGWYFQLPTVANFPAGNIVIYGSAFYAW